MKRCFEPWSVGLATVVVLVASACGDEESALRRNVLEVARDYPELCDEHPAPQPVAYGDVSRLLGVSPQEVIAPLTGTCSATLSWDTGPVYPPISPPRGEAIAVVSVVPDPASARVIDIAPNRRVFGCEPELQVDAEVSLQTTDGTISAQGRATMTYQRSRGLRGPWLRVPFADSAPGLRESMRGDESVLAVDVAAMGNGCQGNLWYDMRWTGPTGITSSGGGHFGSWRVVAN